MDCLPCFAPSRSGLDVYRVADEIREMRDAAFAQKDLPYVRTDLALDAVGWPGVLGRWSPATVQTTTTPVIVITAGATGGGTAGPLRGQASHHLDTGTAGVFDHLARKLPAAGVSVLQLAYRRPGAHRFDDCVRDVASAAALAVERGLIVLVGYSMGGAVVLGASVEDLPEDRILGVCTLASQTRGVPSAEALGVLRSAGVLVVHGSKDERLPPRCSEQIWERLPADADQQRSRRFVLLDGTGHYLTERGEEVTDLVREWILELCSLHSAK
mmetsp:Transcript_115940/g.328104  ORF Transcript_115940/g.328104 Transcript_115940/m.328104 type:complete len:271 (-) Transcript_115940:158-970(-)